ncbi:MAG TPA: nucleoside transporter C-terminal domain-containing protein, partial [Elusimicrobiales bacterium]|nr:nucleoside transporter C-terminal domain-containing protein [Elusimicrobiales bacterium]
TACSSSLVTVHLACQSLRRGESDLALAGGVNLILSPEATLALTKAHMMAPDGRCKAFDAAANGSTVGMQLAINVTACLVAFMAILAAANYLLGYGAGFFGIQGLTIEKIFGWIFYPLAWAMGVPSADAQQVATWMGQKTVLNEFVAYLSMANFLRDNPGLVSEKSVAIASYALCGFANFLSIAIQIGGIGAMAPERRHDLAKLGLYALLAASLAGFLSATIAGILIG